MQKKHIWSQVVFYLGWIMMVFFETTLWSITGLVFGFVLFLIGGYVWALWHIGNTEAEAKIHGPVLVIMDRLLSWSSTKALVPAALLGGGPGVGLVLKKQNHVKAKQYAFTASAVYALTWGIIHAIRPSAGIPVEAWPSAEFLRNLTHLF